MEQPQLDGTWIGTGADGPLIARPGPDDAWLVDRPGAQRFGEPAPAAWQDGAPRLDGVTMRQVVSLPARWGELSGWYGNEARTVLLTHIPEAYFGEPMVLLVEGDRVQRAYGLGESQLLVEDGTAIEVTSEGALRLSSGDGTSTTLARSPRWQEQPVDFEIGGATIRATVITPTTGGPHPAAVLLHGAAGGQRDFCRIQAAALLEAGIAVLIYDKPGHGQSGGPDDPSIFDQAHAAESALRTLGGLPRIDASRIGLAGFSNGMWSAPMVAARTGAAFLVGVGSPGVTMAESEVHRRTKVLRDVGVGEPTLDAIGEAWRCLFGIVARAAAPELVERLGAALEAVAAAPDLDRYEAPGFVMQNPMLSPIPPLVPVGELVPMLEDAHDAQLGHDPASDYARVSCPVFLQYGSLDTSVPVSVSVDRITAALADAGRSGTIQVYPGLEHMLNVPSTRLTGLTPEDAMYQFHDFAFGAGVWADLTGWLRANVVGA
ncbi:alpha/beta hydrolase family protein [Angustibacter sp. McL0619]|uniref:alpha/beta hydrolase n=1 Tax=Angustibacter sp. McL0619 TaxID=3415676 RepID=UPI003CF72D78